MACTNHLSLWASQIRRPLFLDSSHKIPVAKGTATLYVFSCLDKNDKAEAVALGLAHEEDEDSAREALSFVTSYVLGDPPNILFSDDAKGFRSADTTLFALSSEFV